MTSRNNGRRMLFCERSFGIFLFLWGALLIADEYLGWAHKGLFYGHLQRYLPSWTWGTIMTLLSIGRFIAFRCESITWRIRLSMFTLVLFSVISSIAAWAGLWAATFPLSAFVAYISYWCHNALLRDLRLGL